MAHNLWAASLEASTDHEHRLVAYLTFLGERAQPEETIGSVLDHLSDDELTELHAIVFPDDPEV